jgi:hypothetical protein
VHGRDRGSRRDACAHRAIFPPDMPREMCERVGPPGGPSRPTGLPLSTDSDSWPLGLIVLDTELRDRLPACAAEEDAELEASILEIGVLQPLVVWRGPRVLVDGYRRLAVISLHGLAYRVAFVDFEDRDDAVAFRLREQRLRKNLSDGERAEVMVKLEQAGY